MARRRKRKDASVTDMTVTSFAEGQTLPDRPSPEADAQWLFAFLRSDLERLTPGQLLDTRTNLWAFVRAEIITDGIAGAGDLSLELLQALQRQAIDGVEAVWRGEWFELDKGIRHGVARIGDRIMSGNRSGAFQDLYRDAVMQVLRGFWQDVRRCPECGRLFLKSGKQKYCSPKCSAQTRWKVFKDRRQSRDHHQEYVARTKKRLGLNAKVAIKPKRQR